MSAVIDPYLDGELGADQVANVEGHLEGCPACRHQLEDRRALSALLRRMPYYDAPPQLRSTISRTHRAVSGRRRVYTWMAAAAVLVLAAGSVVGLRAVRSAAATTSLAEAVIERHVTALAMPSLIQVASSDQHTVKPWFQGKLTFSPPVPDLTSSGFDLVGGRIDQIDGRVAAVLVYKRRLHMIHVFVWPSNDGARGRDARTIRGFHERHWTTGDLAMWAVSDVNDDDLTTFADAFATSR
jgi:anti-sigma factor RsiW